jgi:exopolysaccharide production protein ExoZ
MPARSIAFIQAFRGIAALQVVFWHASYYLAPEGFPFFKAGAPMGVSLFFIISGFIMAHVTADNDGSFRYFADFLIKRAARIWPAWIVALAIYIAVQPDWSMLSTSWLLNSLAFIPTEGANGDVFPAFGFPILGVGWTLNYEMYFYLFFGVCLLFGRWRWAALASWVLFTLVALPLLSGGRYPVHYMNLMTSPLILMFVSGVVIARVYQSKFAIESRAVLFLMIFTTVAAVACQYAFSFRTEYGVLNWGLSLIPLVAAFAVASKRITIPVPGWLLFLGNISFSLYLLHPVVQRLFDRFSWSFLPTIDQITLSVIPIRWWAFVMIVATSIAAAAVSYHYIERGLCERLKARLLGFIGAAGNRRLLPKAMIVEGVDVGLRQRRSVVIPTP